MQTLRADYPMRARVEVDMTSLDQAVVFREHAEAIRIALDQVRAISHSLTIAEVDDERPMLPVDRLSGPLETLIVTHTETIADLEAIAEACNEFCAKRMAESWEDIPNPFAYWALQTAHTVLLGVGVVTLVLLGYHKAQTWRDARDGVRIERVAYLQEGVSRGDR